MLDMPYIRYIRSLGEVSDIKKQKTVEIATVTFCTDCIQRRINIAVMWPTHVRAHRRKLPRENLLTRIS